MSSDDLSADVKSFRAISNRPQELIPRREIPRVVRQMTGMPANPHEHTIRRWYSKGIAGVRLHVQYIGGSVFTTREALRTFFEQVTAAKIRRHEQCEEPGNVRPVSEPRINLRLARMARDRLYRRLGYDPAKDESVQTNEIEVAQWN